MRLAVIPARGGSKRIPRKNIRPFGGAPMLSWPVSAAIRSGLFSDVVVSTDDEEIAETARAAGAATPFRRPDELSDDHTPTREVFNHAIREMERMRGREYTHVCGVFATAPFVTAEDLTAAETLLTGPGGWFFVFAATTFAFPIQRALRARREGGVEMFHPEHARTRSQDLEEAFHDAGQFYWGRREAFLGGHPMYSPQSFPYMMPRSRVQDIDTPEDWDLAEKLFAAREGARGA